MFAYCSKLLRDKNLRFMNEVRKHELLATAGVEFISYSWIHHISKWDQIQKIGNLPNELWVRNWLKSNQKLEQWATLSQVWLILPLGSWKLTNIHPLSHWVKFLWLTWERVLKCIEWSNKLNLLIELQFSFFSICFSQDLSH